METTITKITIMETMIIMITTITTTTTTTTADPIATEIEMVNVSARKNMSSQAKDVFLRTIAEPTKSTTLILTDANVKMDMVKTH